jgi:hypothetical protein
MILVDELQYRWFDSFDVQSAAVPRFYSQLKKAHKERLVPALNESDLEESFVRGVCYA